MRAFFFTCAVFLSSTVAQAATFTVTSTAEPGDGICDIAGTGDGCTLREAINAANGAAGDDTIDFAAGVTGTIQLGSSLPDLSTNINLQGPGAANLTVNGEGAADLYRIFTISTGVTATLSGLTIANGDVVDVNGGGLANSGSLTVDHCTVSNNTAGGTGWGGGLANTGTLTLTNSTLSGNSTLNGLGGGVFNDHGTVTIANSTFNNNHAGSDGGGLYLFGGLVTTTNCTFAINDAGRGAGITNDFNGGTLNLNNCTITANSSTSTGGGVTSGSITNVQNTIIAGNTAPNFPDVDSAFTSGGYNLIGDNTGGSPFTATGDQTGTSGTPLNPLLDTNGLQNNGGPTRTIKLLSGSPALDQGKDLTGVGTDQRGQTRPFDDPANANATGGDGSDIGALEFEPSQSAPNFVVNTTADHDDGTCSARDCTLREAINIANSDGLDSTITFAGSVTGTIQLDSVLPDLSSNINLQGPGAAILTVSGEGAADPYRILVASATVTISGLTVANGVASNVGGGIVNNRGNLTLRDCVITGNATGDGGGLYNNSILTIQNCTFRQNNSDFGGGAFYNDGFGGNAQATLTNCVFDSNTTGGAGAGIYCSGDTGAATLTVNGCTFTKNTATNNGGGIVNSAGSGSAVLTIDNSTFDQNSAPRGSGGGIFNAGTANITATTISNNSAGSDGGGIFNTDTCTLINSTVAGNHADVGLGGGLNGGTFTVRHCTIANNVAANASGINAASPVLGHTIIANNIANGFPNPDLNGPITSEGYNLIGDTTGGSGFAPSDLQNVNPNLGALANNGGPTQTIQLLSGSPAINRGDPAYIGQLTFDQRGTGFPRVTGGRIDIGAYETAQLDIGDQTITEGNTGTKNAVFTVTLSSVLTNAVTVHYATADGTAKAGTDYTATSGTLTIASGKTTGTISVPVIGDTLNEATEVFYVVLSSPVNAITGRGRGIGTILDNDVKPSITIDDASILEGNTGSQRLAVFALHLSAPSGQIVSVNAATADGTAKAGSDYIALPSTPVRFSVGSTLAYVRVIVLGDTVNEADETFKVNLSGAVNASIADNQAIGTIVNDDRVPALSINDVSIIEGNSGTKNLTFTVSLSVASGQIVSVNYATADGIARSTSDYKVTSGKLTFAAGQTSQTINVIINSDTTVEGDETFYVLLTGAVNANVSKARGMGTILNDDVSG